MNEQTLPNTIKPHYKKMFLISHSFMGSIFAIVGLFVFSLVVFSFYTMTIYTKTFFTGGVLEERISSSTSLSLFYIFMLSLILMIIIGLIAGYFHGKRRLYALELKTASKSFSIILSSEKYTIPQIKKAVLRLCDIKVFHCNLIRSELESMLRRDKRKELKIMVEKLIKDHMEKKEITEEVGKGVILEK